MKLFKNSDKRIVSSGLAIAFWATVMLFVAFNFRVVFGSLGKLFSYFSSVFWGLAIAYLLRPFTDFVEARLPGRIKSERARTRLSATASMLLMFVIIILLFVVLVPRIGSSVVDFLTNFDSYLESLKGTIKKYAADISYFEVKEENIDKFIGNSETLLKNLGGWLQKNYDLVIDWLTDAVNLLINFVIIVSIAAYALFDRKNLKRNLKRLEKALIGEEKTARVNEVLARGDGLMTNFLTSNIIDGLIVAVVNFIFLTIMDAPYTLVLSVILGLTNLVPTFGPIAGGFVGALIIALTDPPLLLPFIIFTLVLQQIDGNVLKPILFGDSTGLSGFWVMVAIVVAGEMFGILGMVLGVPVVAFLATILDETFARVNGPNDLKAEPRPKQRFTLKRLLKKRKDTPKD